jgi:hypothetical protein
MNFNLSPSIKIELIIINYFMNIINLMVFSFSFFSRLLLNGFQLKKKWKIIMGMENNIVEASSSSM